MLTFFRISSSIKIPTTLCFGFPDRNIEEHPVLQFSDNEDLMDQNNHFREDDKKDLDVPFFELESILAATDNFSQAYKLGQGGFGPVYKVASYLNTKLYEFAMLVICA